MVDYNSWYAELAFGGLEDEQQAQVVLALQGQQMEADDPPSAGKFKDLADEDGAKERCVDKYFGPDDEYFDDKRMVFYLLSDTGSMFEVSEPYGDDLSFESKQAQSLLLQEIRLSVLLNRVRLHPDDHRSALRSSIM